MKHSSPALLIPFTFRRDKSDLLEQSCSRARPSVIRSWGHVSTFKHPDSEPGASEGGCAMGTQDGTVFLFNQICRTQPLPSRPSLPSLESRSPSRSRSSTPTSPHPFHLSQRAGVVSGITTEQVEAPKNYVDFEEEPEKLKDILQGRQPKELVKPPALKDSKAPSASKPKRNAMPKSLLSATNSAAFTASSSHPPPPLNMGPENLNVLDLWCHVILPQTESGHGVTSVRPIEDNQFIVVLQEAGNLSVLSLKDGNCVTTVNASRKALNSPIGVEDTDPLQARWLWNHLKVYELQETTIIVTAATINPSAPPSPALDPADNGGQEKSRISILELHSRELDIDLELIGQWQFDGLSYSVGLHQEVDKSLKLLQLSADGHFLSRCIHLLPRTVSQPEIQPPGKITSNFNIPIPNPLKALKPHSAEDLYLATETARGPSRIACDDASDLGELLPSEMILGFHARGARRKTFVVAWSEHHLTVSEYQSGSLHMLFTDSMVSIQDVQWTTDSSYTVLFEDRVECYTLRAVDADNNEVDMNDITFERRTIVTPQRLQTIALAGPYDAIDITSASQILLVQSGDRSLAVFDTSSKDPPRMSWQVRPSIVRPTSTSSGVEVTSLIPLELDLIVQGCADGRLRQSSLIQMIADSSKSSGEDSDTALNGFITSLFVVSNERTKERFLIGGADDGSVGFWTLDHYKMCARWTLFTTSLSHVIQIEDTQHSLLEGCVLCVSADGTVAVIVIDGFQFLFLIPASCAPLLRVCIGSNNLLLVYADNRARLWDVKTQEFWRSMAEEKVEEMLKQGGWTEIRLGARATEQNTFLKSIPNLIFPDTSLTLLLDLERFTTASVAVAKSISTNRDQTRAIFRTLERLRSVLSVLLTPGLNRDIDAVCSEKLGIRPVQTSIGFSRNGTVTLYRSADPHEMWCLSSDVSAARVLSIGVMLNALSVFEEYIEGANTVMIFYATSLSAAVGPKYQPPSLVYLAHRWFDGSNDVRRATRVLFDYAMACMSDGESSELTERWQHHLPCLQPNAERESTQAALSLFLCGYLAAEKYTLLSTSALTDISKSIALYLHDEQSLHRVLAVDLCSRGFHIWQHFIDAMEILRALFSLATSSRKESINLQNVGSQARLAVLQIATSNTALFMTTLGLDILTPPTLEHRKAVMQIVAFLIKKRPLVLQPNIPKLMEAVVRSLDPNVTTHREAVIDTVTEIISYVVKTFPAVDFYMGTQRLAVGGSDGAVVMYDLKTAIRLYVLEGHKKAISACSFSPDGRRLLTLSIEENVALVWKVGSSFASFFNPGAPPRQGRSDSQPFKTIDFNVGEAANMTTQEAMDLIRINWVADRSVKIRIRDSVLTFST
ncbi:WD repeat-containing protein 7 [Termitomyces sp. T112]|nr:WD repeat-containing protein 7 [Termitomyces sp. T112]